jgi:hypothetical protein
MIRGHSKGVLMDEFSVQVFSGGRVNWDRLGDFLRRNPSARRELANQWEREPRRGRRTTQTD